MDARGRIRLAYLAGEALYLFEGEAASEARVQRIESRFGREARERVQRHAARQSWKRSEPREGLLSGGTLWGTAAGPDPSSFRVAIKGIGRGPEPGEILYALDTDGASGVFAVAGGDDAEERRLLHSDHLRLDDLEASPDGRWIACSMGARGGAANIAVMAAGGTDLRPVTEGDAIDRAPSWVPGRARTLVYQSAGIGRDAHGAAVEVAPFSIEQLDLETGRVQTRAEDPRHDLLSPRVGPDGLLYTIRRPYRPRTGRSHWRALRDFLRMPFRLLEALFQKLNLFTAMYTGRKLTSGDGPPDEGPRLEWLVIHGNLIEAARAERRGRWRGEDAPALVPKSWELVRHRPDTGPEVLARGVVAFDVAPDGVIVVSNGSAIDRIDPDGTRRRLCRAARVVAVAILD